MTSLTGVEIKIVFFALFFVGIIGAIILIYNSEPVPMMSYGGITSTQNQTQAKDSQDSWISELIPTLPKPFDDSTVLIVVSIFVTPVVILLAYIGIRAIKDLVSQWI